LVADCIPLPTTSLPLSLLLRVAVFHGNLQASIIQVRVRLGGPLSIDLVTYVKRRGKHGCLFDCDEKGREGMRGG
jgi:hypothetical protein